MMMAQLSEKECRAKGGFPTETGRCLVHRIDKPKIIRNVAIAFIIFTIFISVYIIIEYYHYQEESRRDFDVQQGLSGELSGFWQWLDGSPLDSAGESFRNWGIQGGYMLLFSGLILGVGMAIFSLPFQGMRILGSMLSGVSMVLLVMVTISQLTRPLGGM